MLEKEFKRLDALEGQGQRAGARGKQASMHMPGAEGPGRGGVGGDKVSWNKVQAMVSSDAGKGKLLQRYRVRQRERVAQAQDKKQQLDREEEARVTWRHAAKLNTERKVAEKAVERQRELVEAAGERRWQREAEALRGMWSKQHSDSDLKRVSKERACACLRVWGGEGGAFFSSPPCSLHLHSLQSLHCHSGCGGFRAPQE